MAYDEGLAGRIRKVLDGHPAVLEKKMFGGLAFMVLGHMCVGILKDGGAMVRVGPDAYEAALAEPHVREMDFTGRPMRGMITVDPPGIAADKDLKIWVHRALQFVETLPEK